MNTLSRWEPFRGISSLQEQVNRLFENRFASCAEEQTLTAWGACSRRL